ncbi:MAG: TatD family hydrolase [Candidatus Margulisiibacteriota bacterium]
MLIDTHAHLNFLDYENDTIDAVLKRAKDSDVGLIINVGIDRKTNIESIALANAYPEIYATLGLHPHDAHHAGENNIEEFYKLAKENPKVVGIGEIGLDYYKPRNSLKKQQDIFRAMLDLAKELGLPYIVHNRDSSEDVLKIIKDSNYFNGVMHCFGGDIKLAEKVLTMGMMISFTGVVTFKNAILVQETAAAIPLERIMLESDAPYLAPAPHRGQRNEPAYVSLIAEKIAEIKEEELATVKEITSANVFSFFKNIPTQNIGQNT